MSCQQVSRLIPSTTNKTPVTSEDPYVFTETVPTTPPILFNTQKSRSRVITESTAHSAVVAKSPTPANSIAAAAAAAKLKCNQKSPLTPLNGHNNSNKQNNNNNNNSNNNHNNGTKTQASLAVAAAAASVAPNAADNHNKQNNKPNSVVTAPPPALKHATQSTGAPQQKASSQSAQNKKPLNVCIVRPQLQHHQPSLTQLSVQQHHQQQQLQQKLRKQALSPPPLLQHTPSLWQTPLLLDTTSAVVSPPTSPASLPSPTATGASIATTPGSNAGLSVSTAASCANSGTVTALVTPLVNSTVAAPLPPSKFHHNTLAQHLEKVQCIKKPKKPAIVTANNGFVGAKLQSSSPLKDYIGASAGAAVEESKKDVSTLLTPPSPLAARTSPPLLPPLQAFDTPQHSDSDLNEIPVNVIFRKPRSEVSTEQDDALKKPNTPIAAATPVVNKLKNVKFITPTVKLANTSHGSSPPALVPALKQDNLTPSPNVLRDIVFVQPHAADDAYFATRTPKRDTSSTAAMQQSNHAQNTPPGLTTPTQMITPVKVAKSGKSPQQQHVQQGQRLEASFVTPIKPTTVSKANYKRKNVTPLELAKSHNALGPVVMKRNRKLCLFSGSERHVSQLSTSLNLNNRAVAVIKMTAAEVDADTSLLASPSVLPYCVQHHWLNIYANVAKKSGYAGAYSKVPRTTGVSCFVGAVTPKAGREDRITQHKAILRRRALQLLATRSLQKQPLMTSRRRLLCVDRLLRKYRKHIEDDLPPAKQCVAHACSNKALALASHCHLHITNNATQHIFLPCSAKCADNTQCRIPVFDITHDLPLCAAHSRKPDVATVSGAVGIQKAAVVLPSAYQRGEPFGQLLQHQQFQQHQLQQQKEQQQLTRIQQGSYNSNNHNNNAKKAVGTRVTQSRKRKTVNMSPVGRPQKRTKRTSMSATTNANSLASAPISQLTSAVLQRKSSTTSLESIASNSQSSNSLPHYAQTTGMSLPALAPLSHGGCNVGQQQRTLNFNTATSLHSGSMMDCDLKAHEINQIMAQLVVPNNNNNNSCDNSYSNSSSNHNSSNNNLHFMHNSNDSNFTSSMPLPTSTEDLLQQELLSVCENSSAYASSEDTGLGGLSETELMANAHDADDIPLVDSGLLEENDLANALSALPVDAFNELFQAVHQEERDEVERALELADKHLKSLQQTIGSSIDFLDDFSDVHDEILGDADMCGKMGIVSSMMHSPDTSGIDTSTLFIDSGSNSAGGGSGGNTGNCPTVADIRGLVQT